MFSDMSDDVPSLRRLASEETPSRHVSFSDQKKVAIENEEESKSVTAASREESKEGNYQTECLLMTSTDHYLTHIATFER